MILGLVKVTDGEDILSRHNYGYALTSKGQYYLQTASAHLMFIYKLPSMTENVTWRYVNCSAEQERWSIRICEAVKPLLDSLNDLQLQSYLHIQAALAKVYDALSDVTRGNPRKRGFLTDMISKVTGLARAEDVQRLTSLLSSVGSDLSKTATMWQTGANHFLAAVQTERSRIDKHAEVVDRDHSK